MRREPHPGNVIGSTAWKWPGRLRPTRVQGRSVGAASESQYSEEVSVRVEREGALPLTGCMRWASTRTPGPRGLASRPRASRCVTDCDVSYRGVLFLIVGPGGPALKGCYRLTWKSPGRWVGAYLSYPCPTASPRPFPQRHQNSSPRPLAPASAPTEHPADHRATKAKRRHSLRSDSACLPVRVGSGITRITTTD